MRINVSGLVDFRHAALTASVALAASFITSIAARPVIAARIMRSQAVSAQAAYERQPSIFNMDVPAARSDISFAPFGVPAADPSGQRSAEPDSAVGSVDNFDLVGTLSSVGAWINSGGAMSFVLEGNNFEGYRLKSVRPDLVVLAREGKDYDLRFKATPSTAPGPTGRNPRPAPQPPAPPTPGPVASAGGITPASANGADGAISRERLNELLTNPLGELKNMRLIPSESGNGMVVAGMSRNSLFRQVGVEPKDVITSINGIAINDVGNVSNVVSSLLTGSRLDIQVERNGEPVKFGYAVR
jgi:type II secretion system protein C